MIHNGWRQLPLARAGATPGQGERCSSDQAEGQFSHRVTTPEIFNQVGPFYMATSGPLLHVHSQAAAAGALKR